jgi:hypothetical protein
MMAVQPARQRIFSVRKRREAEMGLACTKAAVILLVSLPLTVLCGAGAAFLTAPAREPPPSPWFAVARLSALPDAGQPQRLAVLKPQRDAWARLPDIVLGYVFVRRLPVNGQVIVLRAEHHRGCNIPVVYDEVSQLFRSTCWFVVFDLNGGEVADAGKPLIGDHLERLPVWVIGDEVWIRYELPAAR